MRRLVYSLVFMSCLMAFTSCTDNLTLGFTPNGIPITLSLNSGGVHLSCTGAIATPVGTISLTASLPEHLYNRHVTYVELFNRIDNEKLVLCLEAVGESVKWESKNCKISVTNHSYSTVVSVESDTITNFLHEEKGKSAGYKPDFPETPIRYFCLVKALNSHVNWEINSFADFFGDVFFGIIWFFAVCIDLALIVFIFFGRVCWWVILLLGYLLGIG